METTTIESVLKDGIDTVHGARIRYVPEGARLELRRDDGRWQRIDTADGEALTQRAVERQARAMRDEVARSCDRRFAIECAGAPGGLRNIETSEPVKTEDVNAWRIERAPSGEIVCKATIGEGDDAHEAPLAHPHPHDPDAALRWARERAVRAALGGTEEWGPEQISAAAAVDVSMAPATALEPNAAHEGLDTVMAVRAGPGTWALYARHAGGTSACLHAREDGTPVRYAALDEALESARAVAGASPGCKIAVNTEWPHGSGEHPGVEAMHEALLTPPGAKGRNTALLAMEVVEDETGAAKIRAQQLSDGEEQSQAHDLPYLAPHSANESLMLAERLAAAAWAERGIEGAPKPTVRLATEGQDPLHGAPPEPLTQPGPETAVHGGTTPAPEPPAHERGTDTGEETAPAPQPARPAQSSGVIFPEHPDYPLSASWARGPGGQLSPHAVVLDGHAGVRPAHLLSEPAAHESPDGVWKVWVHDQWSGRRHALADSSTNDGAQAARIAERTRENLADARGAHARLAPGIEAAGKRAAPGLAMARVLTVGGLGGGVALGALVAIGTVTGVVAPLACVIAATSIGGALWRRVANQRDAARDTVCKAWREGDALNAVRAEKSPPEVHQERETKRDGRTFSVEENWEAIITEAQGKSPTPPPRTPEPAGGRLTDSAADFTPVPTPARTNPAPGSPAPAPATAGPER